MRKSLDEILDACAIRPVADRGGMPTKGILGRHDGLVTGGVGELTGGGNYDANGDHISLGLRPFTEGDWMAYSGCSDPNPMFADLLTRTTDYGTVWEGDLILDGDAVGCYLMSEAREDEIRFFGRDFGNPDIARRTAQHILNGDGPDGQWRRIRLMLDEHPEG